MREQTLGELIDEMYIIDIDLDVDSDEDIKEYRHALANRITGRMISLVENMEVYREFQLTMQELRQLLVERKALIQKLDRLIIHVEAKI